MDIVVQKYGGSSLADAEKIKNAAGKIIKAYKEGNGVVAVLSAMGKTTDELIAKAKEITDNPPPREMDMLVTTGEQISVALMAMALNKMGHKAISLIAHQVGIMTDNSHTKAKITDIKPDRIMEALEDSHIVLVAGFQGMNEKMDYTTLGRGGSDTSAAALAIKLDAVKCEIFTDVDGIFTADPRIVKDARKLDRISYDEMLELASLGAQVMHSRSIELAKKNNLVIHVRSAFSDKKGTLIVQEDRSMEEITVRGVALDKDEAKVTIKRVPDKPGMVAVIFGILASANINVDMIIQNMGDDGVADVTFTVKEEDVQSVKKLAEELLSKSGSEGITYDSGIAKVSVVGVGMKSHAGIAQKMFEALAENEINIEMISTSEIKISCVVREDKAEDSLNVVHKAFELDSLNA